MTVHTKKILTDEVSASLIEVAVSAPEPSIPPDHLAKLVSPGHIATIENGLRAAGDGLMPITEIE
jgi:hypothetical protein